MTKNDKGLVAQGTGQPLFPLEAKAPDSFKFDQAGLKMVFRPDKKEMTLYQGGGIFDFTKESVSNGALKSQNE